MKQNERILVYAVSGFLAIILIVAVFFGRDAGLGSQGGVGSQSGPGNAPGLRDVLQGNLSGGNLAGGPAAAGNDAAALAAGNPAGIGSGVALAANGADPALVVSKPMITADIVAQKVGASRRDHSVRIVRAVYGDTLETLVRRWCCGPDSFQNYLAEAKSLNEQLSVLRPLQEVVLPWVDDELVLAAFEARQPPVVGSPGVGAGVGSLNAAEAAFRANGNPVGSNPAGNAAPIGTLSQAGTLPQAGTLSQAGQNGGAGGVTTGGVTTGSGPTRDGTAGPGVPLVATRPYTVRSGDSLWRIAARLYGKQNAERMVREIKALNPTLGETLRPDQRLLVPEAGLQPGALPARTGT